jgi:Holliday junction resolvasome RuvABC endonuclease subunit
MIKKILGFDVSSSCIGWALLAWNEETNHIGLLKVNYLKPLKKGTLISRLADTRDKIADIINQNSPNEIVIEDILLFVAGRSSANTITILASFNRMVGLLSFDYLGRSPMLYSVYDIRNGLKIGKDIKNPQKEDMPKIVSSHLGITFPWQLSKQKKIKKENYDMSDAISVALLHCRILAGLISPPIHKSKKKKSRSKKVKRKTKQ